MSDVEQEFLWACNTPRDIHEHLPFLATLASQCSHVTEFGIGLGMSDRAFLYALQRPGCELISYDLHITPEARRLLATVSICKYKQVVANTLEIEISETELLFIDTLHNYNQLFAELTLHNIKVSKIIAIHDTVSFGYKDECPQIEKDNLGLMPAISTFVQFNPHWYFAEHRLNCNGLAILKRKR